MGGMSPGQILTVFLVLCCGAASAAGEDAGLQPRRRPNFIVILTDDQRDDTVQYLPAVSRLADQGLRFTNSFVTTPVCGPSRASLLTGRLASTQGIFVNEGASDVFDPSDTIAVRLQEQGYTTALYGKYLNGYRNQFPAVPPGWDGWLVFRDDISDLFSPGSLYQDAIVSWNGWPGRVRGYSTDRLADLAVQFIENHVDQEFFLLLSFWGSHVPLIPAERHRGTMAGVVPDPPPSLAEEDLSDKPVQPLVVTTGQADAEEFRAFWDEVWPKYLEVLLSVDEAVARIVEKLDELDLANDTVVIFTSDNGFMFGEHWWLGKGVPYEESIRVPMVVRYPALIVPQRSEALVLNIDVAPTLAELAGTEIPSDGRSLVPLFEHDPAPRPLRRGRTPPSPKPPWRRSAPLEWFSRNLNPSYVGFRYQNSKVVVWDDGNVEFYRLERDPYELENRRRIGAR